MRQLDAVKRLVARGSAVDTIRACNELTAAMGTDSRKMDEVCAADGHLALLQLLKQHQVRPVVLVAIFGTLSRTFGDTLRPLKPAERILECAAAVSRGIVEILRLHKTHSELQQFGCSMLSILASCSVATRECLADSGAAEVSIAALRLPADATMSLQLRALKVLSSLSLPCVMASHSQLVSPPEDSSPRLQREAVAIVRSDAVELAVDVLRQSAAVAGQIEIVAAGFLYQLTSLPGAQERLVAAGVPEAMLATLASAASRGFADLQLAGTAVHALHHLLAVDAASTRRAAALGAIEAIVAAAQACVKRNAWASAGMCWAIAAFARCSELVPRCLQAGAMVVAILALRYHPTIAQVSLPAATAALELTTAITALRDRGDDGDAEAAAAVRALSPDKLLPAPSAIKGCIDALARNTVDHAGDAAAASSAVVPLCRLLTESVAKPRKPRRIEMAEEAGLVPALLRALETHIRNAAAVEAAAACMSSIFDAAERTILTCVPDEVEPLQALLRCLKHALRARDEVLIARALIKYQRDLTIARPCARLLVACSTHAPAPEVAAPAAWKDLLALQPQLGAAVAAIIRLETARGAAAEEEDALAEERAEGANVFQRLFSRYHSKRRASGLEVALVLLEALIRRSALADGGDLEPCRISKATANSWVDAVVEAMRLRMNDAEESLEIAAAALRVLAMLLPVGAAALSRVRGTPSPLLPPAAAALLSPALFEQVLRALEIHNAHSSSLALLQPAVRLLTFQLQRRPGIAEAIASARRLAQCAIDFFSRAVSDVVLSRSGLPQGELAEALGLRPRTDIFETAAACRLLTLALSCGYGDCEDFMNEEYLRASAGSDSEASASEDGDDDDADSPSDSSDSSTASDSDSEESRGGSGDDEPTLNADTAIALLCGLLRAQLEELKAAEQPSAASCGPAAHAGSSRDFDRCADKDGPAVRRGSDLQRTAPVAEADRVAAAGAVTGDAVAATVAVAGSDVKGVKEEGGHAGAGAAGTQSHSGAASASAGYQLLLDGCDALAAVAASLRTVTLQRNGHATAHEAARVLLKVLLQMKPHATTWQSQSGQPHALQALQVVAAACAALRNLAAHPACRGFLIKRGALVAATAVMQAVSNSNLKGKPAGSAGAIDCATAEGTDLPATSGSLAAGDSGGALAAKPAVAAAGAGLTAAAAFTCSGAGSITTPSDAATASSGEAPAAILMDALSCELEGEIAADAAAVERQMVSLRQSIAATQEHLQVLDGQLSELAARQRQVVTERAASLLPAEQAALDAELAALDAREPLLRALRATAAASLATLQGTLDEMRQTMHRAAAAQAHREASAAQARRESEALRDPFAATAARVRVVAAAAGLLRNVCASPEHRVPVAAAPGVVAALIAVTRSCAAPRHAAADSTPPAAPYFVAGPDTELAWAACGALFGLACEPANCGQLVDAGAVAAVSGLATAAEGRLLADARIAWAACGILLKLAKAVPVSAWPPDADVQPQAVAVGASGQASCASGDSAVSTVLSARGDSSTVAVAGAGGLRLVDSVRRLLHDALRLHADDARVVSAARAAHAALS